MTTIYDVARAAGVSPKTVSRVLNGDAPVNEKTRAVVKAEIDRLHYVPSKAARMMRQQKSGLVGMITGAISATSILTRPAGLPEILILQGAQQFFARRAKILMITDTGGDHARIPELARVFLEHRVEGLVCVADHHQEVSLPDYFFAKPVVLANCFDAQGTPAVVPDDASGQFAAVDGLAARGHRRIGFLPLPLSSVAGQLRLEGYRRGLRARNLDFDPELVAAIAQVDGAVEENVLGLALTTLLSLADPPSAICCGNDHMAMQVCSLLRQRGIDVPGRISIIGYDDHRLIAEHVYPKLASVHLPYFAIGTRAAERLLELVDSQDDADGRAAIERLHGPVVWRESVRSLN